MTATSCRLLLAIGAIATALVSPATAKAQTDVNSSQSQSQTTLNGGVQENVGAPDPIHCFWDAWRSVQNAVQAYQLALGGGLDSSFACHAKAESAALEPCWAPLQKAKGLIERAGPIYERARKTPDPAGGEMNHQANALNLQARTYLDEANKCYKPVYDKWFADTYGVNGPGRQPTLPPGVLLPPLAPPVTNLPGPIPSPYQPNPAPNAVSLGNGPTAYPPLQQASDFSNQMRMFAEAILQAAGRIAKASTDAMDVTKHSDVGIGVAFSGYFGALASTLTNVARQYQTLAAASHIAGEENLILPIANEAASESGAMATQAEQTVGELGVAGAAGSSSLAGSAGYLEDIQLIKGEQPAISQGALPTCTVLSCYRLAGLLGRNISIFEVFNRIAPRVTSRIIQGNAVIDGGLTIQQVRSALQSIGISAEVGTGLTGLTNEVAAGRPLIAGVRTTNVIPAGKTAFDIPLHALVVEGVENRAGVPWLKIYDPAGFVYWQPLSTFAKFFTGVFVKPI